MRIEAIDQLLINGVNLDTLKSKLLENLLELDKQKFETDLRAEYAELFTHSREATEEENAVELELYLLRNPDDVDYINFLPSDIIIDYSEDENYVTFEEYRNETKVVTEAVEATYDEDGMELTPAVAEVTELVRPYIAKTITEERILEELIALPSYKEYTKAQRQAQLDNLTVTTNAGNVFDANDESRANMNEAITAASILGLTSNSWKLHDNTIVEVSVDEIKEALALGIQAKGSIILNA